MTTELARVGVSPRGATIWVSRSPGPSASILWRPQNRVVGAAYKLACFAAPIVAPRREPPPEIGADEPLGPTALLERGAPRDRRVAVTVTADDKVTVVKWSRHAEAIRTEAMLLRHVAGRNIRDCVAPRVRAVESSDGGMALVTEASQHLASSRDLIDPFAAAEVAAELTLAGVTHGDFAPWNVRTTGKVAYLFDWESGMPDAVRCRDLVHFILRAGALIRLWSPTEAVDLLLGDSSPGDHYCAAVGSSRAEIAAEIARYLARQHALTKSVQRYYDSVWSRLATFRSPVRRGHRTPIGTRVLGRGRAEP
jgi:hypothetical protein